MTHDEPNPTGARGKYHVWHRSADGYSPVAAVNVGNLLAAVVYTMIRPDAHWDTGASVVALQPQARSTDIGDVIVSPEGVAYELRSTSHGLVFEPIDFPPHREQTVLFAEWTQDYAAAQERDGKATLEPLRSGAAVAKDQSTNDKQLNREDEIEM